MLEVNDWLQGHIKVNYWHDYVDVLLMHKTVHTSFVRMWPCVSFLWFPSELLSLTSERRHLAVDNVEDVGWLPVWTETEDSPLSTVPPAVHRWRTPSFHQAEGSVRDGSATVPTRSVSPLIQLYWLKAEKTLENWATCVLCDWQSPPLNDLEKHFSGMSDIHEFCPPTVIRLSCSWARWCQVD